MDMMRMLGMAACFVCGVAALCVGLGAMNVNVLQMLQLETFDMYIRYLVGACGVVSLLMSLMSCCNGKC